MHSTHHAHGFLDSVSHAQYDHTFPANPRHHHMDHNVPAALLSMEDSFGSSALSSPLLSRASNRPGIFGKSGNVENTPNMTGYQNNMMKEYNDMAYELTLCRGQLAVLDNRLTQVVNSVEKLNGTCTTTLATLQGGNHSGQSLALVADVGAPPAPLLNHTDFPNINHWAKDHWDNRDKKGVTHLHSKPSQSTAGKCGFVQKADGGELNAAEWKALNSATRGLFNSLQPVPESWMADSTMKQRLAIYNELIFLFPFLGLCNGYWKAEKYVINQYPLWKAVQKWKLEENDEAPGNGMGTRKRPSKVQTDSLRKKKSKVNMDIPNPLLGMAPPVMDLLLTGSATPMATASTLSENPLLGMAPPVMDLLLTGSATPMATASTLSETVTSRGCEEISTNEGACPSDPDMTESLASESATLPEQAASSLAVATTTAADVPVTNGSTTPMNTDEAPKNTDEVPTKRRGRVFQPGPKHTARNVCGRAWKQGNPTGTAAAFGKHWEKLSKDEKKAYDNEAKQLAAVTA